MYVSYLWVSLEKPLTEFVEQSFSLFAERIAVRVMHATFFYDIQDLSFIWSDA